MNGVIIGCWKCVCLTDGVLKEPRDLKLPGFSCKPIVVSKTPGQFPEGGVNLGKFFAYRAIIYLSCVLNMPNKTVTTRNAVRVRGQENVMKKSIRYLNSILTLIAALLAMELWTQWTTSPLEAATVVQAAVNPAVQRQQTNDLLTQIIAQNKQLVLLFQSGKAKVTVEGLQKPDKSSDRK